MDRNDIIKNLSGGEPAALFREADAVRQACCGDSVHLRGLIEFSNYCQRDCCYCGLRKSNRTVWRYRMDVEEIFRAAENASRLGFRTVVLQSGEDAFYSREALCGLVGRIKREIGCAVTLCVGEKTREEYQALREAGADRYLLRFETSDKKLFKKLKPDSSFDARLRCLSWLKELGYQVGSGMMVGLPGQTLATLAEDILLMEKLDLDMIGLGPFIAHPQTPLGGAVGGTLDLSLRVIALTRIVTRYTHIPATTAVGSIDPGGREKALQCGANVIMPNVTPGSYRKYYEIYPHKICLDEKPADCRACIEGMVKSLGRTIDPGYGHSLKWK